jgi:hypothetical protein
VERATLGIGREHSEVVHIGILKRESISGLRKDFGPSRNGSST